MVLRDPGTKKGCVSKVLKQGHHKKKMLFLIDTSKTIKYRTLD